MSSSSCRSASLVLTSLLVCSPVIAADFYKWTDEQGNLHFSDSLNGVPETYQNQVQGGFFEKNQSAARNNNSANELNHNTKQKDEASGNTPKSYAIDYVAFEGQTSRVIIDVTFNDRVTVPMVLDTGAGEVIISEQLAEKLGLFDSDQAKFIVSVSGFGGTAPAIRTILDTMSIGKLREHFIPTRIVPALSESFYGVVGMNFMSQFQMRIDPRKGKVVFESISNTIPIFAGRNKRWWQRYFSEFTSYRNHSKQQVDKIEQFLYENKLAILKIRRAAQKALSEAKRQYNEAEKLLDQLTRHASQNAVPMSWRRSR